MPRHALTTLTCAALALIVTAGCTAAAQPAIPAAPAATPVGRSTDEPHPPAAAPMKTAPASAAARSPCATPYA